MSGEKQHVSLTPKGLGYCAYLFGKPWEQQNPFTPGTDDHEQWDKGYQQAEATK